ncbi:2OG-Fe(II) oxygenase [Sphingomonas nostoxanthinifaciens]|uniref:2OG-Fe(II) oxygenase n=1 Tax=Sphingomonas nostoxanthinifaciens TaxID=2872652 RepID=UPI001CC2054D|nr:2OG-Fe(II) oxygenase family protein [Sphingomonas nostoxanthinifaciens]UAK25199.1 2OG-Fe(II) oxygenase [Sphingomonas nostoxanthinifaciens]
MFALAPTIDRVALRRRFAETGHVRIQPFLAEPVAAAIVAELRGREDWRQILNSGAKIFELDRAARASMPAEQAAALEQAVMNGARDGFQHRYEAIRFADGDGDGGEGLAAWPHWLSGGPVRDLLRDITGHHDIAFADGQATAYAPGDFLTAHDDAVAGKHRRAAYVLGLTAEWRVDWGGLLLFHRDGGAIEGMAPGFNCLDLFDVPQVHSVSLVSPAAAYRRYAITGWLRTARD